MPAILDDLLAALSAAAEAAAAASPFSATPDANLTSQPGIDSAEFGAEQCRISPEDFEGETGQCIDPGLLRPEGSSEGTVPPVDGDRPRLAPTPRSLAKPEPPIEMPPAADVDRSHGSHEYDLTPIDPSDAPEPPLSADDDGGRPAAEPSETRSPRAPAMAPYEWADSWQLIASVMPSNLGGPPLRITGEEFGAWAKQGLQQVLTNELQDQADPEDLSVVANTTAIQTVGEVGIGIASVVIDPASFVRGLMRFGTVSAAGVEQIEEGETLEGAMSVIGEGSAAVLIVLSPLSPKPRNTQMTMYGPGGVSHNVVRVKTPGQEMASHAVKTVKEEGKSKPVAAAVEYELEKLSMNIEKYNEVTRQIPERNAASALAEIERSHALEYGGIKGGIGPYRAFPYEHCATYAATISRAAGIPILGVFGPKVTMVLFKHAPIIKNPIVPLIGGGASENSLSSNGPP